MNQVQQGRNINPDRFPSRDGLRAALQGQEEIGWVNFVLGRWSTKWLIVQQNHFDNINSKCNVHRWVSAIIHKLMMITWDLWDFRNSVIHGPSGPIAQQEHHELDLQLDE